MNHCAISLSFGVFLRDLKAHAGAILPDGWSHQDGCTESIALLQAGHSASVLVATGLHQQTHTHVLNSTLLRHNPINLNGITPGLKFLQDQH